MIEEIQNNKNIELCDELFSESFVNHTPPPGIPKDRDGMRLLFSMTHTGFPDGRISVEDQVSKNDRVWTRKTFTGTHTGHFGGAAPTGKMVSYHVIDILVVKSGKMVEHWSALDRLDLLQQLGVIR
jgi:predicted ester cyclase